jgi:hypothetical protein
MSNGGSRSAPAFLKIDTPEATLIMHYSFEIIHSKILHPDTIEKE